MNTLPITNKIITKLLENWTYSDEHNGLINKRTNTRSKSHINGYVKIHINGKSYHEHRLIYFMFNNEIDPNLTIDHIDNNKSNNNINNLQQLTITDNQIKKRETKSIKPNHSIGFKYTVKNGKGYQSQIFINNNVKKLGTFEHPYDAHIQAVNYLKENNMKYSEQNINKEFI